MIPAGTRVALGEIEGVVLSSSPKIDRVHVRWDDTYETLIRADKLSIVPTLTDYCSWCNSKNRRLLTARHIPHQGRAMICDDCWEVQRP